MSCWFREAFDFSSDGCLSRGLTDMTWGIGILKSSLFWANRNQRKKLLVFFFSHPRKIAFVENEQHKTLICLFKMLFLKKILGTGELNGDEYRGRPLAKKTKIS